MIDRRSGRAGVRMVVVAAMIAVGACSGNETIITDPLAAERVQPPGASFSCAAGEIASLAVGEVRTALSGTSICLRTTAAAEYMVHGFFGSTVSNAQTQVGITAFGITTASGSAALSSVAAFGRMTTLDGSTPRQSLELGFRNYERNVLAPRMSGARAAFRNRAFRSATAAVPAVGDVIQLNASATGCESPRYRGARVAAVTNRAIIVSDTGNPAGGFSDAEFQSIAVTFDTLVDPIDRAAFGDPTDIDANQRVIIFYTRVVNELTPEESEGSIEGFFNPRDLFPRTASATLQACTGSNFAEIFYMLAPDPAGAINNNVRTKDEVRRVTVSVIAHEYQHLINSARRIYVNDADDFEEVWLNEGLSHIAEELVFYRASGLQSRSNVDAAAITASTRRVNAFNEYQGGNFGRYSLLLQRPERSSPYADNDSLSNRGAIWSFLRYAADRKSTSDGTIWQQLVNSKTSGIPNLTAVFTTDIVSWVRDWSISVYTDDLVATSSMFQQPSWNFRSIYPRLGVATFPLHVLPLVDAVRTTQTLTGGGAMFTRFGVPAAAAAGVAWSVTSPNVAISIVRTK